MYKCERCDWTGESSELGHYTEYRGECHGGASMGNITVLPGVRV